MTMCALLLAVLPLVSSNALTQTNATQVSPVGTWKADLAKSSLGSDPAPKAVTLTILTYTPASTSWRVDEVGPKGESISYSWTGPLDGSMQPVKDPKGQVLFRENLSQDKDGALLRRGVDVIDGTTFEARATLSADGGTINDVITVKTKDGKVSKMTMVFQRVTAGK